jgi:hypothetical protein
MGSMLASIYSGLGTPAPRINSTSTLRVPGPSSVLRMTPKSMRYGLVAGAFLVESPGFAGLDGPWLGGPLGCVEGRGGGAGREVLVDNSQI